MSPQSRTSSLKMSKLGSLLAQNTPSIPSRNRSKVAPRNTVSLLLQSQCKGLTAANLVQLYWLLFSEETHHELKVEVGLLYATKICRLDVYRTYKWCQMSSPTLVLNGNNLPPWTEWKTGWIPTRSGANMLKNMFRSSTL